MNTDDILSQIDEVVNSSEELSDDIIEKRAQENGLERVPRDVDEVIKVLFVDAPALVHGDAPTIQVNVDVSGASAEAQRLLNIFRISNTIRIDDNVIRIKRIARQSSRVEAANEWFNYSTRILNEYERGGVSSAMIEGFRRDIRNAHYILTSTLPGDEISAPEGREIRSHGGGIWSMFRRHGNRDD